MSLQVWVSLVLIPCLSLNVLTIHLQANLSFPYHTFFLLSSRASCTSSERRIITMIMSGTWRGCRKPCSQRGGAQGGEGGYKEGHLFASEEWKPEEAVERSSLQQAQVCPRAGRIPKRRAGLTWRKWALIKSIKRIFLGSPGHSSVTFTD